MIKKKYILYITIALVLVLVSLILGTTIFTPDMIFDIISGNSSQEYSYIFFVNRFPRVAVALIIGASLAVSGTNFQALLRNSLADPYILGVSGGAAFGAAIGIVVFNDYFFTILFSFLGSMLTIVLVLFLYKKMELSNSSLLLAGLALGFIFNAGVMLFFFFSQSHDVHKTILWLMGNLELVHFEHLYIVSSVTAALIIISLIFHKHLNIISFGKEFSLNLGVSNTSVLAIFFVSSFLAAISVAFFGIIGFVGLIVPHVMRSIYGPDHKKLIPAAAFGGALFLLICDTIGRTIHPLYPIPIGVITGLAGGVFFIILVVRQKNYRY